MAITYALDNETFLITRARPFPTVVSTAIANENTCELMINGDKLYKWFLESLQNPEIRFVGHNIAYDMATAAATWPTLLPSIFQAYEQGRITDTGIRQQLFDIAMGRVFTGDRLSAYSLASLYETIFDKQLENKKSILDDPNNPRYNYGRLYGVPLEQWPQAAIDYAKADAVHTFEIWQAQNKVADLLRDDAFQAFTAFCLSLISARGMRTDPVAVALLKRKLEKEMKALEPELIADGLLVWDKRNNKFIKKQDQARDRIVEACNKIGVEPRLTDKGKISIDKVACYWSQDAMMLKRVKYAKAEQLLTTYVPFLEQGYTLPITTRFHLVATGRTSSSGPRPPLVGGNFQNMPRDAGPRECIVPRKGLVFLAGDFSGAELHTLAQVCKYKLGYSVLGDTLNSGKDVHLYLASVMLGIPYDDAVQLHKDHDKKVKKARQDSKPANFGFGGGMGIDTFIITHLKDSEELWTREHASYIKRSWLEAFPEMSEYFDACSRELGPKETCTIELYYSKRLRRVRGFSTICNSYFQALTADGAKRALHEVIKRCYVDRQSSLYGARPVNFVHDELILEIKDNPAVYRPAAAEFAQAMAGAFNVVVPDYPTHVDAVLMRRWSKSAEPVFDEKGQLIPWDKEIF